MIRIRLLTEQYLPAWSIEKFTEQHTAIFPLLSAKMDSGTAIHFSPLSGLIFRYI
jgi:hypothetical protein